MEAFPAPRVPSDAAHPAAPRRSPAALAPLERERLLTRALLDLASSADREPARHAACLIEYLGMLGGRSAPEAVAVIDGRPSVTAASGRRAEALRQVEEQLREGPLRDCLAGAVADGTPLTEAAEAAEAGAARWPRFAARARELGVRRVTALPLTAAGPEDGPAGSGTGAALGALVLYHDAADPQPPECAVPARALAEAAALHLRHRRARSQVRQLEHALRSRIVIEQAKGVLSERFGVPTDGAFVELRRYARSHQRSLHDLARSVVDGTAPDPFRKDA
ncbi:ANTAR domain-containing protein [Streptomyces niger]|uniref:ANTAR domain-containing protein n=1 Tax=Streptomyces niger TaxID=66373 RepID=UPI0018FE3C32|nr:ANTAR domain-containing protein [Streptomyces niger]